MRCNKCFCEMPYDTSLGNSYDCIYCEGTQTPSVSDILTYPDLKVVNEQRPAQIQLSQLIDHAFFTKEIVIAEAGTGVGKSFAYLLPAILSGKRTIISTAKKSLQSQLLEKDLPYLKKQMNSVFKFAPAYGKSNYACQRAVYNDVVPKNPARKDWDIFFNHSDHGRWEEALQAFKRHGSKPKIKLPTFNSNYTADSCVGNKCGFFTSCGYIAARKEMLEANVVVANHWLVGYHFKLKRDMKGYALLGDMDYLIVDEAHKFEDGVRAAFTEQIKENALKRLFDNYEDYTGTLPDTTTMPAELPHKVPLLAAWDNLFAKVRPHGRAADSRVGATELGVEGGRMFALLEQVCDHLESREFLSAVLQISGPTAAAMRSASVNITPEPTLTPDKWPDQMALLTAIQGLRAIANALKRVYEDSTNTVAYITNTGQYCAIEVAPIEIAPLMKKPLEEVNSSIFVSATLAINGTMDIFRRRVGVSTQPANNIVVSQFGSAFNLAKQALLYISTQVPEPTRKDESISEYRAKLAGEIYDLVVANNGNAFVLFTARDEMRDIYSKLVSSGLKLPLVIQDNQSAADALRAYKSTDGAVLLGLKSFWEGVDVAGDKLSLVILTKLPFPGRSDPIISARREKSGDDWFHQVDLPDMILDLRQGVGRLIRTQDDRGVIAILDQRLITKKYKTQVLRSLGLSQATSNKEIVLRALTNLAKKRNVQ